MHQIKTLCLLLCAMLLLSGCAMLELEASPTAAQPALQLLSMPPYQDQEAPAVEAQRDNSHLRVDMWLDASQLMGGINASNESLYPHFSRKYREGGFHYRSGKTVGWYENVLRDMLAAAGEARVRVLRTGNERLTDDFLLSGGLSSSSPDGLRSLRRDMLTCAVNPMPDFFSALSAEEMENSFYALGSPRLNQMARFLGDDGAELENPGMTARMSAALDRQIAAFEDVTAASASGMSAVGDDLDSPLHYALENLDLSRLSIITCDPAALRRLNGTAADGAPVAYITALLDELGVFDAGLKVGLYAMRLDYLGQMTSFGAADFSDPLIWGRMKYNSKTYKTEEALPMPRTLLALAVGKPAQVDGYTAALNAMLTDDPALRGLRGPGDGELSYTANGQTVVQQPFTFSYEYTDVSRPTAGYYTQHTQGMSLSPEHGGVTESGGLNVITLNPGDKGASACEISWPAVPLEDGISLDLSALTNVKAEVIDSCLFTGSAPNTPDGEIPGDADVQALALRDTLYLFTRREYPFADAPAQNPFAFGDIAFSADGKTLRGILSINPALLTPGYYRVRVSADAAGEQVSWPPVSWTEDGSGLSVDISNGQISQWEAFSAVLTRYARAERIVPRQFDHAWGGYTSRSYKGATIPDFPPVSGAPHLSRLFSQLREAANVKTAPYIRCVFDVFVPNP